MGGCGHVAALGPSYSSSAPLFDPSQVFRRDFLCQKLKYIKEEMAPKFDCT